MAGEARIQSSLSIRIAEGQAILLDYRSSPASFVADVSSPHGKVPGGFLASVEGVDVDLSQLTCPGLAFFHNGDGENYVEIGVYVVNTDLFVPYEELLPGEGFGRRLSRNFGEEYEGTGTGTSDAASVRLRVRANTAPCWVTIEVFEK